MKQITSILICIVLAVCMQYAWTGEVEKVGRLYKWTDEKGQVHYSDKPPPDIAKQERQVLNEQGVVVETLAAQKTEAQLAEERRQTELVEQQHDAEAAQAKRDQGLLAIYSSVADIERARDSRIAAVEAQARVTSGAIAGLEQRIVRLEEQVGQFANAGKDVPAPIAQELDSAKKQLMENEQVLLERKLEQDAIREKYAEDIERYKRLKGIE